MSFVDSLLNAYKFNVNFSKLMKDSKLSLSLLTYNKNYKTYPNWKYANYDELDSRFWLNKDVTLLFSVYEFIIGNKTLANTMIPIEFEQTRKINLQTGKNVLGIPI